MRHPPRTPAFAGKAFASARQWLPVLAFCAGASCSDVQITAVEAAVIELEPPRASILLGESVRMQARLLDQYGNVLAGRDITWSSSDPVAVPIDDTGLVQGVAAGLATVTAASGSLRATADVEVNRPAPRLDSARPSTAQRMQSLDVVLTGSDFQVAATTVGLGSDITIEDISVTSDSITLRATILPGAQLGPRDVSVTTPAPGGGTATLPGGFSVLAEHPEPALTNVTPAGAQREETLQLTIVGAGFVQDLTTFSLGADITVDAIEVTSPGSLTASIGIGPDAALGPRDVYVSNPAPGGGTATLPGGFTVAAANPVPALTAANPPSGQRLDTVDVTLTGSGFRAGLTTVTFGPGVDVNGIAVHSPTALTATVSIAATASLGARNVAVTNPSPGGGSAVLAGGFTVLPEHPVPSVLAADPATAQRRETLDVTLTGTGFVQDVTAVSLGPEITVNTVRVDDSTSLTANVRIGSAAALGTRDVSVTNGAPGGGTGTLSNGFTVLQENPPPSATMALPDIAPAGVTANVTLLGSGFVQGLTTVSFGADITVNSVTVIFWTSLVANITIAADAAPGPRGVSVTNPAPGGGTFVMNDGFTVLAAGSD
jgi:hypothetical protein